MNNETQLPPCPLTGAWRYSNGFLMCGTLRIFRADFDTDPSPEFKDELTSWMVATLNAAPSRGETHGQAAFWVLEQFKNEQGQGYWKGCCSQHWTKDIDEATQFCRKQDALSIWRHASLAYEGFEVRAVEHAYIPAQSTERCAECGHDANDPRRRGSDEYNSFCILGCGCDCDFSRPVSDAAKRAAERIVAQFPFIGTLYTSDVAQIIQSELTKG